MSSKKKERLDRLVAKRFTALSRRQIQSAIMQGYVLVNGKPTIKSGTMIAADAIINVTLPEQKYVSRAGLKLEKALDYFSIDVTGLVVLDAGISTGGFTHCLFQRGAKRVYGIDVGYGQVHEKIRADPRLVLLERTNVRYLTSLPEPIDLATLDLSFISLRKVLGAVNTLLASHGSIIALIKPQFEADRTAVGRGGTIKDPAVHEQVIIRVKQYASQHGFVLTAYIQSPLQGAKSKNKEFLALLQRTNIT